MQKHSHTFQEGSLRVLWLYYANYFQKSVCMDFLGNALELSLLTTLIINFQVRLLLHRIWTLQEEDAKHCSEWGWLLAAILLRRHNVTLNLGKA